MPVDSPSPLRWIPRVLTAAAFVFCLGFFLHTAPEPVYFGRYNGRYIIFLIVLFGVLLPLFFFTVRFFFTTHELRGSGQRRIVVGPFRKLTAGLIAALLGWIALDRYVDRLLATTVSTRAADIFHPYLQNVPRPSDPAQHTNRWGFKGDEIELQKPDDVFRLFFFGGSTVHCGTVPYEQTHVYLLQEKLRAAYPGLKIEVQNLGCEWHTTQHCVIKLLSQAQDFSPDLVVVFHGINDLSRALESDFFAEGHYRADYGHFYGPVANMVRPGRAAKMFFDGAGGHWCSDLRFQKVRVVGPEGKGLGNMVVMFFPKTEEVDLEAWSCMPSFERNLRDFVSIAQGKGMQVLLGTQPSLYREDLTPEEIKLLSFPPSHQFHGQRASIKSWMEGMRQCNEITKRIAADRRVEVVDLAADVPQTTEYLYDDVHYTAAGNIKVAEAFAEQIIASDIIPRTLEGREKPAEE